MSSEPNKEILKIITEKTQIKQLVYENTLSVFSELKEVLSDISESFNKKLKKQFNRNIFELREVSLFQAELKVAGDVLVFKMHSNIFEFDRDHGVWKISYVQNNKLGTYCGIINIYNFLSDSFTYNRTEDLGYLVGRIFINKDKHYFVEGKRQMGFLYNDFGNAVIDKESLQKITETAIAYSLDFDLLVPPYEEVMIVSLEQMIESKHRSQLRTGKRLGFQFRSNDIHGEEAIYTGG